MHIVLLYDLWYFIIIMSAFVTDIVVALNVNELNGLWIAIHIQIHLIYSMNILEL